MHSNMHFHSNQKFKFNQKSHAFINASFKNNKKSNFMHSNMHFQSKKNFKRFFHAFLHAFFKKKQIKSSYSNKFHALKHAMFRIHIQPKVAYIRKCILQKEQIKRKKLTENIIRKRTQCRISTFYNTGV